MHDKRLVSGMGCALSAAYCKDPMHFVLFMEQDKCKSKSACNMSIHRRAKLTEHA